MRVEDVNLGEVHPDPERQDRDRRERETRRAAERSRAVDNVLAKMVEPRPAPLVGGLFPQAQRASEVPPPVDRHHLAMRRHLVFQFLLQPPAMEEGVEAAAEFAHVRQSSEWLGWPRSPVHNPKSPA